jgi:hypothetical protein
MCVDPGCPEQKQETASLQCGEMFGEFVGNSLSRKTLACPVICPMDIWEAVERPRILMRPLAASKIRSTTRAAFPDLRGLPLYPIIFTQLAPPSLLQSQFSWLGKGLRTCS